MLKVVSVTPLEDYILSVGFDNGEVRKKDIKPLLEKPVFSPLKDISLFNSAFIQYGAITWRDSAGNEIDLCPDNVYMSSEV